MPDGAHATFLNLLSIAARMCNAFQPFVEKAGHLQNTVRCLRFLVCIVLCFGVSIFLHCEMKDNTKRDMSLVSGKVTRYLVAEENQTNEEKKISEKAVGTLSWHTFILCCFSLLCLVRDAETALSTSIPLLQVGKKVWSLSLSLPTVKALVFHGGRAVH